MQPLVDTADAGLSYLDTVLSQTADASGVVPKTCTRIFLVQKLNRSTASPSVLDTYFKNYFAEVEADATGIVVIQSSSMWALLECSPESVAGVLRRMHEEIQKSSSSSSSSLTSSSSSSSSLGIQDGRIVGVTEDCPHRLFDQLYCTSANPANENIPDLEAENPVTLSTTLYRSILTFGYNVMDAPNQNLRSIDIITKSMAEPQTYNLPSDERCQAIATLSKLMTINEWLHAYDQPLSIDATTESVYPLPIRTVY